MCKISTDKIVNDVVCHTLHYAILIHIWLRIWWRITHH